MASMLTIRKLHAKEPAPVESDKLSDLEIDVSEPLLALQTKLWSRSRAPRHSAFQSDSPAIMSAVAPGASQDRSGRFAELAARERLTQMLRAAGKRRIGRQDSLAIHA
jgi:hypothetical protein